MNICWGKGFGCTVHHDLLKTRANDEEEDVKRLEDILGVKPPSTYLKWTQKPTGAAHIRKKEKEPLSQRIKKYYKSLLSSHLSIFCTCTNNWWIQIRELQKQLSDWSRCY
ncbi:hypothetical protein SAMN05444955_102259 [Lihuaxuella thermophila]|uniref:Uncharacterized protein n=1 Tax=Lihuaxuella thermophila TaxID=1173111 RepID=A0A1H8BP18_9BACL|nr:hypothetical protein SAMN05444955_102259 [Lihuaxuella thermophila]